MSVLSWKKEFYPVAANSPAARKAPVAHALRKWQGLRTEALAKHGVALANAPFAPALRYSTGRVALAIDADTCALCQIFLLKDGLCKDCPLYILRGKTPCYLATPREEAAGKESPYHMLVDPADRTPEPMIRLLRRAIRRGYP